MSDAILKSPAAAGAMSQEALATYRKITWRLLPFLFLAYAINTIDRINISFAKLHMARDLGLSDAAYGLGAAAFFVGYILFEVPSNLYMQKVGARATLTRIMVLWGLVTVLTSLVASPTQLCVARFLLGVAEAGFFPGVILYLSYWFPAPRRGRVTSLFFMAAFIAGIVSGPLAGSIMTGLDNWHGMKGWQTLFILEGVPAILMGAFAWYWLDDQPAQVNWLSDQQKAMVVENLRAERDLQRAENSTFWTLLRDSRTYIAGAVFFSIYCGTSTVTYWMPSLLQTLGFSGMYNIGFLASVPYFVGMVAMYLLSRSSDKHLERRWHLALTMISAAGAFALMHLAQGHVLLSATLMTIGSAACMASVPVFWTIPPTYFTPATAAGGIALISSIGGLAAVLSPVIVGSIKTHTGSLYIAFDALAGVLIAGAIVLLLGIPAKVLRGSST